MNDDRMAGRAEMRPTASLATVIAALIAAVILFVGVPSAVAQDASTTTTPTTEAPTTTESSTTSSSTSTTEAPTTTTARSTPTTVQRKQTATTTTTESTPSTTVEEPSTTSSTEAPTTTEAPTIITPSTVDGAGSNDAGLSTSAKLALVIGGLLAVALAITVLTVLYWRHTRPVPIADGGADDQARTDRPDANGAVTAGAVGAASTSTVPVTEQTPVVTSDATSPGEPTSTDGVGQLDEPDKLGVDRPPVSASEDEDAAALREALFGPQSDTSESYRPVTLEDLFGPSDDPKGSAKP